MKKFFKILKRIFIAILIVFIGLMAFGAILTKCGKADAREYTASAATEEPEVVEVHPRNINNGIMPLDGSTTGSDFNFNDVWFNFEYDFNSSYYYKVMDNVPAGVQITVEFVVKTNITGLVDLVPTMIVDPWGARTGFTKQTDNLYTCTFTPTVSLYRFLFDYYNKSEDLTKLEGSVYVYYGSYVPGYGQGLAAGIQQGYQDGYNQGASDTSSKYIAGIFGEATAQFGYTNQPVYSSIQFSDIQKDINDYVSFTGFPELTENYSYYVINIVFPEKIHYTSGLFQFIFNNKMPVESNGFVPSLQSLDSSFITITFNSGTDGSKNQIFVSNNLRIPIVYVEGTNYSYEISNTWLSQFSVDFQSITICTKLIPDAARYPNPYQTLQSLKFSNGYSDNANYYAGYDTGYNDGYDKGENAGYGNGIKEGYNNGYDVGLKEGEINGYTKAVAEGVSQEGIFYGAISFLRTFFQLTTGFLGTKIVGNITLGLIVIGLPAVGLIGNLAIGFVKKVMGSRGADE